MSVSVFACVRVCLCPCVSVSARACACACVITIICTVGLLIKWNKLKILKNTDFLITLLLRSKASGA